MIRRTRWGCIAATLLIVLTTFETASAQSGGFRRSALGSGIMGLLVRSSRVRTELGLSNEQQELIAALQNDLAFEYSSALQSTGNGLPSAEEVSRSGEGIARRILSAILRPSQYQRLVELQLQRRGLRAIDTDELAGALGLSDDQRAKAREKLDRLSRSYGRGRITDEDARVAREITDLLDQAQKDKWEELLGKEFKFR